MAARKSKKKVGKAKRGKPVKKPARKKAVSKRAAGGDEGRVAEIQRLIDVMVAADAVEVEMEEKGCRLRVRLKENPPVAMMPYAPGPVPMAGTALSAALANDAASPAVDSDNVVFNSPMVGTFYRAPTPEAEPFVRLDQEVTADTTICILEAMKVMNEIKAEMEGVIVEILAENGESIEFGQPLFVLKVS